jgi:hypothetical protein
MTVSDKLFQQLPLPRNPLLSFADMPKCSLHLRFGIHTNQTHPARKWSPNLLEAHKRPDVRAEAPAMLPSRRSSQARAFRPALFRVLP